MSEGEDFDGVTGKLYEHAWAEMEARREYISTLGTHPSREAAYQALVEANCHHVAYKEMAQSLEYIDPEGRLLNAPAWKALYGSRFGYTDGDDKFCYADPKTGGGISVTHNCSEQEEMGFPALYRRDYFRPWGHYDAASGTFNVAKPCMNWARETGADVRYVFDYLRRLAGDDNFPYLCAWLREKLITPTNKTEVLPIFVSRAQGTGKTTFAEVICKALFGEWNVFVTEQFDSSARFNADSADALIICIEEKQMNDRRNTESSVKSLVTNPVVRKEHKGRDPYYQKSCTDFIMTSNGDVPIKFESGEQRRFMVMEVDGDFTRANPQADEVFTKLYGFDAHRQKKGKGFAKDADAIQQFKYELLHMPEVQGLSPRDFVRTDAFDRCVNIPRTSEAVDIETLIKGLGPFIEKTLAKGEVPAAVTLKTEAGLGTVELKSILGHDDPCIAYFPPRNGREARVAINKNTVFVDSDGKRFAPATVEHGLNTAKKWLGQECGVLLLGDISPPEGGFPGVKSRYKFGPCAWFVAAPEEKTRKPPPPPSSRALQLIDQPFPSHRPPQPEPRLAAGLVRPAGPQVCPS
jgi:hypothetical protein